MRLDAEHAVDHLDRLYRAAMALTGDPYEAEDLVQSLFEALARRPREIWGDNALGYLLTALRHRHLDTRRALARRPRTVDLDGEWAELQSRAGEGPDARLEQKEILALVAALPGHQRDVLVAVDICGLGYEEAARRLGIPVGTVMSRLHRARRAVVRCAADPTPRTVVHARSTAA